MATSRSDRLPRSLNDVLDRLTTSFINSSEGVQLRGGKTAISQLFDWYGSDFVKAAGSVGRFLACYHKSAAKLLLAWRSFPFISTPTDRRVSGAAS